MYDKGYILVKVYHIASSFCGLSWPGLFIVLFFMMYPLCMQATLVSGLEPRKIATEIIWVYDILLTLVQYV